jgi:hypothetical protein
MSREWTEPFLLMSASDFDPCVVERGTSGTPTRWQVEVIGYEGRGEPPLGGGPTFVVCPRHLTQQLNRFVGRRR